MSETTIDITHAPTTFNACAACGLANASRSHNCQPTDFDCCAEPNPTVATDCRAWYQYDHTDEEGGYVWRLSFTDNHDSTYFSCSTCGTELDLSNHHTFNN